MIIIIEHIPDRLHKMHKMTYLEFHVSSAKLFIKSTEMLMKSLTFSHGMASFSTLSSKFTSFNLSTLEPSSNLSIFQ